MPADVVAHETFADVQERYIRYFNELTLPVVVKGCSKPAAAPEAPVGARLMIYEKTMQVYNIQIASASAYKTTLHHVWHSKLTSHEAIVLYCIVLYLCFSVI